MKKFILGMILLSTATVANAQSEKFVNAMKSNIDGIANAFADPQSMIASSNSFERIALAEKNQWLPYYYAALTQVNYGFMQKDKAALDGIANKAGLLLQKADSLLPDNSEISCVKSMIATIRLLENPMERYMEFGPVIESALDAAKKQDPTNPRPYYLKGESLKNTPAEFGGGCIAATAALNIAKEKFSSFKPASPIHPNWGAERTEQLINECNKK